jgi:hypothetical protein
MKGKRTKVADHDPWSDLLADETLTNVPLGQVFPSLRMSAQQAGAIKQGLLDELSRLTDGEMRTAERGVRKD